MEPGRRRSRRDKSRRLPDATLALSGFTPPVVSTPWDRWLKFLYVSSSNISSQDSCLMRFAGTSYQALHTTAEVLHPCMGDEMGSLPSGINQFTDLTLARRYRTLHHMKCSATPMGWIKRLHAHPTSNTQPSFGDACARTIKPTPTMKFSTFIGLKMRAGYAIRHLTHLTGYR